MLAGLLQHGAPPPEPGLPHAAANLPGRFVDMWTIGVADRLRFPRFPSELGKQGNAHLRPHPHDLPLSCPVDVDSLSAMQTGRARIHPTLAGMKILHISFSDLY